MENAGLSVLGQASSGAYSHRYEQLLGLLDGEFEPRRIVKKLKAKITSRVKAVLVISHRRQLAEIVLLMLWISYEAGLVHKSTAQGALVARPRNGKGG